MSPVLLLSGVLAYCLILLAVAHRASRRAGAEGFYVGGRQSPWLVVAFGMIGTSLSGVTFISVPGAVAASGFGYLQVTLGYVVGYVVIAFVLLPHYHRLGLASIYELLGERLGPAARRLGSACFVLSRTVGATARLYLVVQVLHQLILGPLGLPFAAGAAVVLAMILLYTVEGGVKALVWTDTLQTAGMLTGLVVCTALLWRPDALAQLDAAGLSRVWVTDPLSRDFSAKALLAGAFIAIAMTGLDQEMMQKNLSVSTVEGSKKNMRTFSVILLGVNLLFLLLGSLLFLYLRNQAIAMPAHSDDVFPTLALQYFPPWLGLLFIIGLISALFPSADGALTALTASTCIDLIGIRDRGWDETRQKRVRQRVHLGMAVLFLLFILYFHWLATPTVIKTLFDIAGFTYGPLLGLFAFGIFFKARPQEKLVPWVCVAAPVITYFLRLYSEELFFGYRMGFEVLLVVAGLTMLGLWAARQPLQAVKG